MSLDCERRLGDVLDDLYEFVDAIAVFTGERHELPRSLDDGTTLGRSRDRDAAAAAEFEQAFVAELAEGAEDGVGVDAENVGEVFGGWESFAGFGFAVGDGAADLACDLFVQVEGVVVVELDISHGAMHYSSILIGESL
jgi:hypothetical protein